MKRHRIWAAGHRLSLAWLSLACAAVTYFEPTSLMHATLINGGYVAQAILGIIVMLAASFVVEWVLNDIPTTPLLPGLIKHRLEGYMLQVVSNMAFVFVLLKPGDWTWIAGIYFVLACGSLWIAVQDTLGAVNKRATDV